MSGMNEMVRIGIDGGWKSGAIAVLWPDGKVEFCDVGESMVDALHFLRSLSAEWGQLSVSIEYAGRNCQACKGWGHLRGACIALGIPIKHEPTPAQWKRAIFGNALKGKTRPQQKNMARDMARKLFPQAAPFLARVKDADRAEALLIMEYGRRLEARREAVE